MNKTNHVILGAHGAVGQAIIAELKFKKIPFRAVERSKDVPEIETVKADLLDLQQTINVVKDATHVYLSVGIVYHAKIWAAQWPVIMSNVITACEKANAKLVFLDNIYMYGPAPLSIPFDETHEQNPQTKKGKTRKIIADMLLDAHKTGRIKAVIGRSPDFYGPKATNSMFYMVILKRMLEGKAPQWLAKPNVKHTYSYTGDVGKALVALALDDKTYGQAWHLPVGEAITIEEIVEIFNKELKTNFKISLMPAPVFALLSVFVPILKEVKEMNYQFENDYIMSDKKFINHFSDFKTTKIETGIREMIKSFKDHS